MRRILLVLTVAALMAAMVVSAGPAKADVSVGGSSVGGGNTSNISNGVTFISVGSSLGDFDPGGITFSSGGLGVDID